MGHKSLQFVSKREKTKIGPGIHRRAYGRSALIEIVVVVLVTAVAVLASAWPASQCEDPRD